VVLTSWWSTAAAAAASAAGGLIPGVGGAAAAAVGGGLDAVAGAATLFSDLTSAAFWKRIGVFTAGAALVIVGGVVFFLSTKPGQEVTEVAGTAALA
jgi:hypothetical protein